MAKKRYLQVRYKGGDSGWSDWSPAVELVDALEYLAEEADFDASSYDGLHEVVGDTSQLNNIFDVTDIENTIDEHEHLRRAFQKSEVATVKWSAKLADLGHHEFDSVAHIAADESALDSWVNSRSAMDAVTASETAMEAVTASETAMEAVAASETAFPALWTAYDGFSDSDIPSSINSTQESSNGVKIRFGDDLADHWLVRYGPSDNAPDGYTGYVLGMNDQSEHAGKHLVGFPIDLSDRDTLTVWLRNTANFGNHYASVVIDDDEVATQKDDEEGWVKHEIDVSSYGSTTLQFGYNVSDTNRSDSDYWIGIALEIPMVS